MSQKFLTLPLLCALLLGSPRADAADLLFVLGGDDPGESAFVSDVTQRLADLHALPGDRIASVSAGAFRQGYALAKGDRQVATIDVRTRGHISAPRSAASAASTLLTSPGEPPSAFQLLSDDHALLIPIGETALKAVVDADASESLLTTLIDRSAFELLTAGQIQDARSRQVAAIVTDQPLERQLALITAALPKARRIGLVCLPTAMQQVAELRRIAVRLRLQVNARSLEAGTSLTAALQPVLDNSDALLVLPDALPSTAGTGQALLQAAARSRRPVITSSESFLRAGALISVFTTREQFARQTAESIHRYRQGMRLAMIDEPHYFSVRHNASVADSLGMTLSDDTALEATLASIGVPDAGSAPAADAGGRK